MSMQRSSHLFQPAADANGDAVPQWLRIRADEPGKLADIKQSLGLDIAYGLQRNLSQDGEFSYFAITFLGVEQGCKRASRVIFVLGRDMLLSLEPSDAPQALEMAQARMQRQGHGARAFESFVLVLQAINDATDALLDSLNSDLGRVLVQTNAVLGSLEARDRDFGVSDVVAAQLDPQNF